MLHSEEALDSFCSQLRGTRLKGADAYDDLSYIIAGVNIDGFSIFRHREETFFVRFAGALLASIIDEMRAMLLSEGYESVTRNYEQDEINRMHRPYRSRAKIVWTSEKTKQMFLAQRGQPHFKDMATQLCRELQGLRGMSMGQLLELRVNLDGYYGPDSDPRPPSFYFSKHLPDDDKTYLGNGGLIWHPKWVGKDVPNMFDGSYSLHH
jgi:hypothetical protein